MNLAIRVGMISPGIGLLIEAGVVGAAFGVDALRAGIHRYALNDGCFVRGRSLLLALIVAHAPTGEPMYRESDNTNEVRYFEPGQQIVLRFRRNIPGEVIIPVTIVEDGPTHVAFYTAPGTPYKGQATVDGERLTRDTSFVEREQMKKGLADGVWSGHHTL